MSGRFFITGMPRSRTTWLANLFTYGDSFCFHDATAGTDNDTVELASKLALAEDCSIKHIGDSDSGLLLNAGKVAEMFPSARWLLVKNTTERVVASWKKFFAEFDPYLSPGDDIEAIAKTTAEYYEKTKRAIPIRCYTEISVDSLDNLDEVERVWNWLVPGSPFNRARAAMLDTFKIDPFPRKTNIH